MDWSSTIPNREVDRALRTRCHKPRLRRSNCQRVEDLQLLHGFANVVEVYVIRDVRNSDPGRDDEPDISAFEFFVDLYYVQNFFTRKARRQARGQLELAKKINNGVALLWE